jgi:hypothetical protein
MTDAELQALWDENITGPVSERLSEGEFFKKYTKEKKPSGGGFGPAAGALALGDWALGFGSKALDFTLNAPEAIWDVARGQSPDEELGAFYGRDVRDNATARLIEENPVLSALTGYRPQTSGGQFLERGEEWALGKLSALGEKAYDISKGDPMRTYTEADTPISRAAQETSSYLGNLFGSTIKYGVPLAVAHRGAKTFTTGVGRDVAGSAVMGGAGLAQRALPGSNVLESAGRFVGERRLKTTNLQLQQLNDRRNFTRNILGINVDIPNWYNHPIAKVLHTVEMAHAALKHRKDAKAALEGFTPNIISEMEWILGEINAKRAQKAGRSDYYSDIFHGQVAHILTTLQKMEPYSARTKMFEDRFSSHIFPDNVKNVAGRFSSNNVLELMDKYLGEPLRDSAILDAHVTPFLKMGQNSGIIHMSTKAFHRIRQNIDKMGHEAGFMKDGTQYAHPNSYYRNVFSFKGQLPLVHQVNRLMREQGPNATKDSIISALKELDAGLIEQHKLAINAWKEGKPVRSTKRGGDPMKGKEGFIPYQWRMRVWKAQKPRQKTYAGLNLEKNIVDSGGYISVQQAILSHDTLLATILNRAIFDKANPSRGAVFNFDSYQLGTGKKIVDAPLTMGADTHRIFVDIIPWSKDFYDMVVGGRESGGAVIAQLPAVETQMVAPRGRPRLGETPQLTERGLPVTGASIYQAPLKQMRKYGIM